MAIKTVTVTINGNTYTLTNTSGNTWSATLTAPGATSWNKENHEYPVTITATNTAGTTVTDSTYGVRVKETVAPVITISSPTGGARVTNNKQPVVFTVVDEAGGSGVNISALVVKQDGATVPASAIKTTAITNGYSVTYTPANALSDGAHTVTITGSDNDGNTAAAKSTSYTIDTVPPALNITSPANNSITNAASCVVAGTTNDATSSPVTLTVNGTVVTVNANGSFSTTITLSEGLNTINIVAKDSAGKTTTVTRTVTLDTSKPAILNITITPNPADTGASMVLTVTVEG